MDKPEKTCILVTGTHRTFTSLVANIFHNGLGVPMGKRFLPTDWMNPRGYWEDLDFRVRNQQMIGGWAAPRLQTNPADRLYFDRLIRERFKKHDVWGVKDVRFCFTLPVFVEAFPFDARLEVLVCLREYDESARSIERVMKVPFPAARNVVIKYDYNLQKSLQVAKLPGRNKGMLTLQTALLFSDPEPTVRALAALAGVDYRPEALDIIDPELRHFGPTRQAE